MMISAMVSTSALMPQLGGSLGLAVLNTLAAGATINALDGGGGKLEALVSGYSNACLACAVILVPAAVVTALMYRGRTDVHGRAYR